MSDQVGLKLVADANIGAFEKGLTTLQKGLATTAIAANKLDSTLGKSLPKGANQAGNALTNLGRVAQDAPFGFVAIQNNLNPLLESFQRLKAETGSTGSALKALGSSLLGPAGLGIALSVVSAVMIKFPNLLSSISDEQARANAALKAYNEELGKAAASTATELNSIQSLLAVAQDESNSRETRLNAIKELQKEYPGYLQNINIENVNSVATANAVNALADALGRKAKIQALDNLLTKESEKMYKLQKGNNDDLVDTWDALVASIKNFGNVNSAVADVATLGEKNRQKELTETAIAIFNLQNEIKALTTEQAKAGDFSKLTASLPKLKKELKEVKDNFKFLNVEFDLISKLPTPPAIELAADPTKNNGTFAMLKDIIKLQEDARAKTMALADAVVTTLGGAFQQAFEGIIGGGQNAMQAFGNAIKQVIVRLAAAAATAALLAGIIGLITGGSSFGGGAASFGGGFKALLSSLSGLPKFDKGVTDFKGGLAYVHKGEMLVNLPKGTDVIPRQAVEGFRGGGMQPIVLETRISGNDIVLVSDRTRGRQSRNG